MDIIAGLTSFGIYLNTKQEQPIDLSYDTTIKRTPINGINIYNASNYRNNKNYIDDLAYKRYQEALNPQKTGMIPNFYNQFKDVSARNDERRKKFLEEQHKKDVITLEKQKEDVDTRTLKYGQIFVYGIIPFLFLLILLYLTF